MMLERVRSRGGGEEDKEREKEMLPARSLASVHANLLNPDTLG